MKAARKQVIAVDRREAETTAQSGDVFPDICNVRAS